MYSCAVLLYHLLSADGFEDHLCFHSYIHFFLLYLLAFTLHQASVLGASFGAAATGTGGVGAEPGTGGIGGRDVRVAPAARQRHVPPGIPVQLSSAEASVKQGWQILAWPYA